MNELEKYWDNSTLEYNLEKYNWPEWALHVIQEIEPKISKLENIHKVLAPSDVVKIGKHVQNACSRKDFMEKFDAFVEEYVPQRINNLDYLIQRQGTLRVVIPNQEKVGRRLQFHQGIFVGNGRGCRTIWTPFTEAKDTNTMWIVDAEKSREITKSHVLEKWTLEKMEEECLKHARPVNLKPGQSHLFTQEMLHGNVNNKENYTRVSLDMRILIKGEEYGRRDPGGFMRLPGDYEIALPSDYSGKQFITYAGWASKFTKNIPLPMQRATIEPYCEKNKIKYTSYEFENDHCDWQPSLEYFIKEKPDGIVLCSMYAMTDNKERRNYILNLALDLGVELHFANESTSLKSKNDLEKLKTYLDFAVPKKNHYVWEK